MKLVEKKCPSCGAQLKFEPDDVKVTCEYCNNTYQISKDETKDTSMADAFTLTEKQRMFLSSFFKGMAAVYVLPFVAILFIFAIIFISSRSAMKDISSHNKQIEEKNPINIVEPEKEKEKEEIPEKTYLEKLTDAGYITGFEQIDKDTLSSIHENTTKSVKNEINRQNKFVCKTSGSIKQVGMYLLLSESGRGNYLIDVQQVTFIVNGKKKNYYVGMSYHDVKIKDNKVIVNYSGSPIYSSTSVNQNVTYSMVLGYDSTKAFYNNQVLRYLDSYKVIKTGDVYQG